MKLSIIVGILIGIAACGGEPAGSGAKIAPPSNAADIQRRGGAEPAPETGKEKQLTGGGAAPAPPGQK